MSLTEAGSLVYFLKRLLPNREPKMFETNIVLFALRIYLNVRALPASCDHVR